MSNVGHLERLARVERRLNQQRVLIWSRSYCASQGATLTAVIAGDRHASVARVRHRLWMILRHTLGLSFPELAILFEVDHTTVMSGVKKCERALEAEHAGRAA